MDQLKPLAGGMLIGPQPSKAHLQQAKLYGIRTVIDLRMPTETALPNAELVVRSGLAYVNIPVNRARLSTDQVDELDRVMREQEGPFLLHCASGARAVMLLVLSKARHKGWGAQSAFEQARAMGINLESSPQMANFVKATVRAQSS